MGFPGEKQEAGGIGRSVLDTRLDDIQVVEFGTQPAGDGGRRLWAFPGQHLGSAGRVIEGVGFQLVAHQKSPALGQGLGMRIDHADLTVVGPPSGQQTVFYRHLDFTDDLQFSGGQQIVDLGHRPFQRVFHRHHP